MAKRVVRAGAAAAVALTLSGCLSFGNIDRRATTINESIGSMQNRAVLLNLARASRSEPLYFLSLNSVSAQGMSDLKLAAPGFSLGPLPAHAAPPLTSFSNSANVLDNSTNSQMTVSIYNTQEFYSGVLAPLSLDEVDLLLHQGLPRELIFYLVIDRVKLTDVATGGQTIIYNDPTSPTYALFRNAIRQAMDYGLTTAVPPNGEPGKHEKRGDAASPPGGIASVEQPPGGEKGPPPHAQLCFEKALATEVAVATFKELEAQGKPINYCGEPYAQHLTVMLEVAPGAAARETEVEVTTRSVYRLFYYLGGILNEDSATAPRLVDYGGDYARPAPEHTPEQLIMNVTSQGGDGGDCFSAIKYAGRDYCVPLEDSDVTRDVFNTLTILVGLKQKPGQLPPTGTLLIAP